MAYPQTKDDTVLYDLENVYGDKDITVRMLDGSTLNLWGQVFVNGDPVAGGGTFPIASQAVRHVRHQQGHRHLSPVGGDRHRAAVSQPQPL